MGQEQLETPGRQDIPTALVGLNIGLNIGRLAHASKLTVKALADAAGMAMTELVDVLSAETPLIAGAKAAKLRDALKPLSPLDDQMIGAWAVWCGQTYVEPEAYRGEHDAVAVPAEGIERCGIPGCRRCAARDAEVARRMKDRAWMAGRSIRKLTDERGLSIFDLSVLSCTPEQLCLDAYEGRPVNEHLLDRMIRALDDWSTIRPHDLLTYLEDTFAVDGWNPERYLRLMRGAKLFSRTAKGGA